MVTERFELRLEGNLIDQIDVWRSKQEGYPSRSEAVRQLISAGLGRPEDRQLFQIARFNLLWAAREAEGGLSDAYVYAWSEGVYPLFHSESGLHGPFAEQFVVPSERVAELAKFLDGAWLNKAVPSFYKLEDHYETRTGRGFWDRSKLIHTCRYMYLQRLFDDTFWNSLLVATDHPAEAKSIVGTFDRKQDIYFN